MVATERCIVERIISRDRNKTEIKMNEVKPRPGANVPEAGCKFFWRMPFFLHRANEEERKKERQKEERKKENQDIYPMFFFYFKKQDEVFYWIR